MAPDRPAVRPMNPRFSSGPCAKHPGFSLDELSGAVLGRSHRAAYAKARLRAVIDRTRAILRVPADHRHGIAPASDPGAVEVARWNLLGARPGERADWESFGAGWVTDAVRQLRIDASVHTTGYGAIVDMSSLNYDHDVCFTWNGTTSGARVPSDGFIPAERKGLTLCDATSAAFAMDLPWDRLDATTFSWQKVLGGEAAHGMLVLSPRAVERLESHAPSWPLPKIFRLTEDGKLNEAIFEGATINTPSMLCVEDCLAALDWAQSIGGLDGLVARTRANFDAIHRFVAVRDWIDFLVSDPNCRSETSVCLKFTKPPTEDARLFARAVVRLLEAEGIAYDIGSYRDAPPGLRVWCGATVESSDIEALMPWVEWAYRSQIRSVCANRPA